ncbi:MAG: hypothetical protein Unbinned7794contig1000_30 [Prokaryotic dsDNA virus sp.]|nr:MAG: hypothetical protein Unbinned7794contig1000_30 [Prokaryotic dsDNA virus sp.]|tara:strand:+ start:9884 stop:10189 length:306 start_codon:yes stop_codon:yes gene_type:complete
MSNEPKETNLFGASVSQKLDIFRYTEQDGERACHIAQAADDARTLEAEVKRLTDENALLIESADSLMNTRIELEKEVQRLTNKCNAMQEQLKGKDNDRENS